MDLKDATTDYVSSGSLSSFTNTENNTLFNESNKENVSEDEGYVSGSEEFEEALDKPVLIGSVEEATDDGNFDAAFVDAPDKVESFTNSGVIGDDEGALAEVNNDVDENKAAEVVEVGGDAAEDSKESDVGRVEFVDVRSEVIEPVEVVSVNYKEEVMESGDQAVVTDVINAVVEGAEARVEESDRNAVSEPLSIVDVVTEPKAIDVSDGSTVELEKSESIDTSDVNVAGEMDSASGETVETGDVTSQLEEKQVAEDAEGEPERREVSGAGDVKRAQEGDSIVYNVQVDAPGRHEAVVVGAKENRDGTSENEVESETTSNGALSIIDAATESEVNNVSEFPSVEPENSESVDDDDDVALIPEENPILETIQAEVGNSGQTEENRVVKDELEEEQVTGISEGEPERAEVSSHGDIKRAPEGASLVDSVQVDAPSEIESEEIAELVNHSDVECEKDEVSADEPIQVDVSKPGMAVLDDADENGEKIEGSCVPLESVDNMSEENDAVMSNPLQPEDDVRWSQSKEEINAIDIEDLVNGAQIETEDPPTKPEAESETTENGTISKAPTGHLHPQEIGDMQDRGDEEVRGEYSLSDEDTDGTIFGGSEAANRFIEELENSHVGADSSLEQSEVIDGEYFETEDPPTKPEAENETIAKLPTGHLDPQEIGDVQDHLDEEVHGEYSLSDEDTDGTIFGGSEAANRFIEELENSHAGADSSLEQSQVIDGQIVTDSEEDGDDDGGEVKELFDSAALAALLKAATGADSDAGTITITSQDGSRLFSMERPAGLGSSLRSLRPAARATRPNIFGPSAPSSGGELEVNLSEDEKKKLEKLQQIRVKFLRLVHRLGLSLEESVAAQVLYRLALLGGRQGSQIFSLDAAKTLALELEAGARDDLDFSLNILVVGKYGVGKSATINSLFGEEKAQISAFSTGTASAKEVSGLIDGVKVRVIDTPGLKSSVMEQGFNRRVLSSINKFTKKNPADVVLYVDRLDAQSRDLNDLPLLKTVTGTLGSSIWRNAVVTLTHGASAPPDGPSGAPLSYEVFVSQRSHVVQQSIGHAIGDLRMMSPSLMTPVSLVENHSSCRRNREGQKILPNGQIWRPQLLLLCYSMKILSEASALSKPQDTAFDHRKLFGFRARAPPLPYMLSSMLQSRPLPKLPSDQGGDNGDSDIDLDDLLDSDEEDEDEYDQLPPFKPLRKAQVAMLSGEQRKAYFEEYDYRVKLLQKKQWREEVRRMKEIKKRGKNVASDYRFPEEDDADSGAAAPVAVPLPDMALPPSFDGDNPAYRYRFLEPTSQFLARPVLDTHGWDHDCGYDGVNLEHSLAILSRFPASYTIQITKDKKDFTFSLDSSIAAKHGDKISTMANFDIQSMGKQLAYILRAETKFKNFKRHKAGCGMTVTFLGENVVPGLRIEDHITLGRQYALVGSAGAVKSQHDTAYGANLELQRRELDYPIGQIQSTLSMSVIKWRGDLALGFNGLAQFAVGRNSKVAVRAGINNKRSGQVTVRTSSSEHLSLALAAVIPTLLSIYKKLRPSAGEKYSIY